MEEKRPIIGRVIATEKHPTTIDDFAFWTKSDLVLNPFDIVQGQSWLIVQEIKYPLKKNFVLL